jgi:CubicO group peptidase (beta-lactamase class C family)
VRRLVRPLLTAAPGASGLAVGMYRDGQRAFVVRGTTAHGAQGVPVESGTRFETGSLTKTFTALLLAELAARGDLGHHDPLARHLPPGTPLPRGGEAITLAHLATHTSGLPRLPPGLLRSIGTRMFSNPYERFSADDVLAALGRARLHAPPGARFRYSNFGAALLGHALSGAAGGTPYGALLIERVLGPLGLRDTDGLADPPDHAAQVTGYWHGRPRPPFRIPGLPAAGAVRSSARDLLRVTELLMDPAGADPDGALPASVRAALRDVTVPRFTRPRGRGRVALVWLVRPRPDGSALYHHSGGTRGCTAFAAFHPARRTALVALANAAPGPGNTFIQRAYDAMRDLSGD